MDKRRMAGGLARLGIVFNRRIEDAMVEIYASVLNDLGDDALEYAIVEAERSCERFPPPAVLRRLAGVPSAAARAADAWERVMQAMTDHGAYRSVDFGDPRIHSVIRSLGGWVYLCSQSAEQLQRFVMRDFCRLYTDLGHVSIADSPGPVQGIFALGDAQDGLECCAPVAARPGRLETTRDQASTKLLTSGAG